MTTVTQADEVDVEADVDDAATDPASDPATDTLTGDETGGSTQSEASETLVDVPRAPLRPALEAVLMVADQPLDVLSLATAVGHPADDVAAALRALARDYDDQERGFELREVAGGWRYYSRDAYAPVVESFVLEGQQARLTQAALETLAVVAYQQPVSRARVSAVRGVNVDGVMRTLLTRGLVEEAGTDETSGAHLYRTTSYFLERIGVTSLDDLPELAPFLPELDDLEDELGRAEGIVPAGHADADPSAQPGLPEPAEQPDASEPTPPEGPSTEPDGGTETG